MESLATVIGQLGRRVPVYVESVDSTDKFGHSETSWAEDRTALCFKSYANRNETRSSPTGEFYRDRPVFFFELTEAPGAGDRIVYDGQAYEMESPTAYESHVALMGRPVQTNFP
jgi:hypothetical protein